MFKFKKGNSEKLEGKVLIYTSVLCPHSEKLVYPALYTSSSPLDVILFQAKQMGMPDSIAEEMTKEITNKLKEEKECNSKILYKSLSTPTSLEDIEDFSWIEGDVVEGAGLSNLSMVTSFLTSLSKSYMTLYFSQLESKVGIDESLNEILKKSNFTDSYKNYKPEQLKKKLYCLTGLLMDSIKSEHKIQQDKIISDIISFTKNSFLYDDAIKLIGIVKGSNKDKLLLSELYINKITAVYAEDYESAEKIKKNIESLEKI